MMSTAVIGATGRVGSEIVRGLLARGDAVAALVRDPGKARRAFGERGGLHIRPTRLDDPRDLTAALDGIFSASLLAAAPEVRASRTWTGLAGTGRMALIDHRDAAGAGLRVLTDPALWGAHHDLTGPVPMSWPEALELLSAELGEPVTFRVAAEQQFLGRLTGAGVPAGTAELLITREWAILAGENDYTTGTFQQITGRPPRPVAEFLHQYRAEFA